MAITIIKLEPRPGLGAAFGGGFQQGVGRALDQQSQEQLMQFQSDLTEQARQKQLEERQAAARGVFANAGMAGGPEAGAVDPTAIARADMLALDPRMFQATQSQFHPGGAQGVHRFDPITQQTTEVQGREEETQRGDRIPVIPNADGTFTKLTPQMLADKGIKNAGQYFNETFTNRQAERAQQALFDLGFENVVYRSRAELDTAASQKLAEQQSTQASRLEKLDERTGKYIVTERQEDGTYMPVGYRDTPDGPIQPLVSRMEPVQQTADRKFYEQVVSKEGVDSATLSAFGAFRGLQPAQSRMLVSELQNQGDVELAEKADRMRRQLNDPNTSALQVIEAEMVRINGIQDAVAREAERDRIQKILPLILTDQDIDATQIFPLTMSAEEKRRRIREGLDLIGQGQVSRMDEILSGPQPEWVAPVSEAAKKAKISFPQMRAAINALGLSTVTKNLMIQLGKDATRGKLDNDTRSDIVSAAMSGKRLPYGVLALEPVPEEEKDLFVRFINELPLSGE